MFEGSVGHTAAVTIGTPHSRAVTPLREKGVDVTSHDERVRTQLFLLRNVE